MDFQNKMDSQNKVNKLKLMLEILILEDDIKEFLRVNNNDFIKLVNNVKKIIMIKMNYQNLFLLENPLKKIDYNNLKKDFNYQFYKINNFLKTLEKVSYNLITEEDINNLINELAKFILYKNNNSNSLKIEISTISNY